MLPAGSLSSSRWHTLGQALWTTTASVLGVTSIAQQVGKHLFSVLIVNDDPLGDLILHGFSLLQRLMSEYTCCLWWVW